ncbi:MAG: CDP-alcohol phosphatidyltransferase family protein [Fusobacterium gastrosuis]|uniref:CDP-alcohol phosphatidyltransferase family protein n=1 Tax=Fusobacterium gastrosuis TaxID=1755100 RepID=UPI002A87E01B|nr:CDP-alcohol phosphatidyltransferase family protein [Fusobacterium gastrosuis]
MDISIYKLKKQFQNLLMPLCKMFANLGISPNQITIFTIILNIIFAFILYKFASFKLIYLLIPFFFLIRMALNALDGMLASNFNMKTKVGVFLNETGDIISDTVVFYVFFKIINSSEYLAVSFIFLSILTEYIGVVAFMVDGKRHYEGPMGKSDRVFFISILSILIYFNFYLFIDYLLIIGLILLIFTIFNRLKNSLRT